jgi:hypothetical protein
MTVGCWEDKSYGLTPEQQLEFLDMKLTAKLRAEKPSE